MSSPSLSAPERDLVGYGPRIPAGTWPNGARLAINVVINYEEGSERSFAMGDPDQEPMTEWGSYAFPRDIRNLAMESMYEYGSRVGIWRILDSLADARIPATFFACAVAFEQNPDVARAAVAGGHEICSHGYRWEEVFHLTEEEERDHIVRAIRSFEQTCGKRPVGWYCRYGPSVRTRRLVAEEGGFLYDSDAYNDDVPYFVTVGDHRRLVVPYTCDVNDIRFWNSPGLAQAEDFFLYMRESFEVLYAEAARGPRMMSIGLHPRMIGRPGRIRSLKRFFDYARQYHDVWFTTREEIARAWLERDAGSEEAGDA
ncbi:Peptidoglycan/xylan/chitin deacetylase, PgdA/CDA1 family [Pseudoxanthobacter soli DSM 19599]|uniref:Chitooligosaccharide deacetylase n=1 Tax=Pseudoxanthobacter soli DSM 19599 TaxID=1123029 RepID=A0A1M7ZP57_9HYPH|nr:allantoinase PuuE [Pseudoxanthobacter soli]SHO66599.1 Peptidoglycan/xylan/chitin deacetylase, PgdA/CDA1 family [Pseudoxanthobacter soli DSM 19599]